MKIESILYIDVEGYEDMCSRTVKFGAELESIEALELINLIAESERVHFRPKSGEFVHGFLDDNALEVAANIGRKGDGSYSFINSINGTVPFPFLAHCTVGSCISRPAAAYLLP